MGSLLLLLRSTGITKLWPYILLGGLVLLIIAVAYTQGKTSGSASEKSQQLNDWLNTQYKEAKDRADIHSMRSSDARRQLRERWAKR